MSALSPMAEELRRILRAAPDARDLYLAHVCEQAGVERLEKLKRGELAALCRKLRGLSLEDAAHWVAYQVEELGLVDETPVGLEVVSRGPGRLL